VVKAVESDTSELYGPEHRRFQDAHRVRKRADRLEEMAHSVFEQREKDFIESTSMLFLSTVDALGQPTVSYKGGAPGFVRVTGPGSLTFPLYDGNGMFLSLGNIASTARVGLLFIDFDTPRRLRVHGEAAICTDPALIASYPGALSIVTVSATHIFINCGRYIHSGGDLSRHVPDAEGKQPFPSWKRLDFFSDTLSDDEAAEVAQAGGTISVDQYRGE
jgi:predicted pyridoxine 5'-phosphate oxidase superfamily flavin-nucleotide-binding protein